MNGIDRKQQRAEIKSTIIHWLEKITDAPFSEAGLTRRRNSLVYGRSLPSGTQRIRIQIEHGPLGLPGAAAAVYPHYEIIMPEVNRVAQEMLDPESQIATTLFGPVGWTSPGESARWPVYQADSVPAVAMAFHDIAVQWAIPFLDRCQTPEDLCDVATSGNNRVAHTESECINVIAARALCGRTEDAIELANKHFGRPGPRRRYASMFSYLLAKSE